MFSLVLGLRWFVHFVDGLCFWVAANVGLVNLVFQMVSLFGVSTFLGLLPSLCWLGGLVNRFLVKFGGLNGLGIWVSFCLDWWVRILCNLAFCSVLSWVWVCVKLCLIQVLLVQAVILVVLVFGFADLKMVFVDCGIWVKRVVFGISIRQFSGVWVDFDPFLVQRWVFGFSWIWMFSFVLLIGWVWNLVFWRFVKIGGFDDFGGFGFELRCLGLV